MFEAETFKQKTEHKLLLFKVWHCWFYSRVICSNMRVWSPTKDYCWWATLSSIPDFVYIFKLSHLDNFCLLARLSVCHASNKGNLLTYLLTYVHLRVWLSMHKGLRNIVFYFMCMLYINDYTEISSQTDKRII